MRATALTLLLVLPALAACGQDQDGDTLRVLAAASLTETHLALAEQFEADHEGVEVDLIFGSSTDLAETAAEGAPGDVLATADQAAMQIAVEAGATGEEPVVFAENQLVIATTPGNPDGVETLDDLDGLTWVRCADLVPCGRVSTSLLAGADSGEPASLEADVKATLEKVTSGEADAGLVYATDAAAAGADVESIPIDGSEKFPAVYVVAPLAQAADPGLAAEWIALLTAESGRRTLLDAGFSAP